jgi:2-keto-4-pentenoate hydratase/2-oxohepta-3-ene-1,7-dioic acid hydratase in catechol pathway
MHLVCFRPSTAPADPPRVGALFADECVLDLREALGEGPAEVLPWLDLDGPWLPRALAVVSSIGCEPTHPAVGGLSAAHLLAPVPRPGKVVCIGRNYREHAAESGSEVPKSPIVFSKFGTTIVGPGDAVVLPPGSAKVDYEAELAVVIGRRARRVTVDRALDHVLGYANFNDVSARDFQFADGQWQRGKSCDTFGPFGPSIVTRDEIEDPHRLGIRMRLNGQTMQDSTTAELVFGVPQLVAFISQTITLEPGDVIATGTPPGVGFARKPPVFLQPGDVMEVEIDGLGVLRNPVAAVEA